MPLTPDTLLGPYRIKAPIGSGGMGEVYRAEDTSLGRDVAIKVLPDAFAHDSERLARFDREARTLAFLNHPNIAVIYGIERSAGHTALVMELVEGDTLADRLRRGPLAIDEAIGLAVQIAQALEAAHQQGIIHRDLKPANIKIRPDGGVKVLDFGLAKVAGGSDAHGALNPTPAETTYPVTATGVVVGTPAYMSPEQASGESVDLRTDVWAFGCVLYEMLTGRRAFFGATSQETFAAVLTGSPDWSSLPPAVPTPIRVLLRRCLARDRRERVSNMGVALFVLEERRQLAAESTEVARGEKTATGRRRILLGGGAMLMAGAVAAGSWIWLRASRPSAEVVRTIIPADTYVIGTDRTFTLTPDGSRLAYISSDAGQIFVRSLGALDPVSIFKTASLVRGLFASGDGTWIGYIENNFTLRKIPVTGGAPVTVVQMDGPSRGAVWASNGTIVFATGAADTGLQQVSADGGPVTVLTRPDHVRGEADHVSPAWLPGGRGLLFTILTTTGGLGTAKIAVLDLRTGALRTLIDGAFSASYVESGHLVYCSGGALRATRFDLSKLETQGVAIEVMTQIAVGATSGVAYFDVAANGTLVYPRDASDPTSERRLPVWVDRQGRETTLPAPADTYIHPRLSPDDKRLAFSAQQEIHILDLTRHPATPSRMTFAPGNDWFPVWTPDGERIVFGSWRAGGFSNLYIQQPDRADAERLTDSADMQLPTDISPDGTAIIFHSFTRSLQALRLRSGREPVTLVESPVEERNGTLSADGRWLAYEAESSSNPGELEVYVRPFPDVNRGVWQVSRGGGTFPLWSRRGGELYYVKTDGTMMAVPVETTSGNWRAGVATPLFRGNYLMRAEGSLGRHYDVARDGRFLMLKREPTGDDRRVPHFVVVQHWDTELARLVP